MAEPDAEMQDSVVAEPVAPEADETAADTEITDKAAPDTMVEASVAVEASTEPAPTNAETVTDGIEGAVSDKADEPEKVDQPEAKVTDSEQQESSKDKGKSEGNNKEKVSERDRHRSDKERSRDKDRRSSKDRDRDRDRGKDKDRKRDRKDRSRDRDRDKDRDRERRSSRSHRSRSRDRSRRGSSRDRRHRSRSRDRSSRRERDRDSRRDSSRSVYKDQMLSAAVIACVTASRLTVDIFCRDKHRSSRRKHESGSSDDEYGGYVPRKRQEAPQPGLSDTLDSTTSCHSVQPHKTDIRSVG